MQNPDTKLLELLPRVYLKIYEGDEKVAEAETSRFSNHDLKTIIEINEDQGKRIVFKLE